MTQPAESFRLDTYILHHVLDSHTWHPLPFLPAIRLPSFISLHTMMMLLAALLLLVVFCFVYRKDQRVPTGLTGVLEAFVVFIRDQIAIPSMGERDGIRYTPMFCTLFFFILFMNLLGLIPIFASATANVNITGPLAFITFFLMTINTMRRNGIKGFVKAITPGGLKGPVLWFVVFMEFVSIFIKSFALMIRLFANMLAGHMMILALLGIVTVLGVGWWKLAVAVPAVGIAVAISGLELFVAFLQAYIFILLSAVFIGQMYHPEH
jgi:F-type H+-transporting ATPase subunit a